jgi:hypothetical protein
MSQDECEKLLEEYQALRRRLEEIDFSSPDYDAESDDAVSQSDIDRLDDLRDRLETECDVELPDKQESDIDLPEYAAGSPSEPRDFSDDE